MRSLKPLTHALPALSFGRAFVRNGGARGNRFVPLAAQARGAVLEPITSTQNDYVKHCVKLRTSRKYRLECNSLLLCGLVVLEELLGRDAGSAQVKVKRILTDDVNRLPAAFLHYADVVPVSGRVLKKVAGVEEAAGIVAAAEMALPSTAIDAAVLPNDAKVLVLDGVQDPGNVGSLIRTAAGLGWAAVWLTQQCCDPFSDKAMRAARGATFRIRIGVASQSDLLRECQSAALTLLAAAPGEDPPSHTMDLEHALSSLRTGRVGLVLGSEGQGLGAEVTQRCAAVSLPMHRGVESLNVAAAGAIFMMLLADDLELAAFLVVHPK